ncbi:MAG: aminoglycoside phosphotransferase family protein [Bacteroidota bacterium]
MSSIPAHLIQLANDYPENQAWLKDLPAIIEKLKKEWHLDLGQPLTENATCSYVAPCTVNDKAPAVLKIGLPHEEAMHEIEGLQLLNGQPTVQLLRSDKTINAMLLEKCVPGTSLKSEPEPVQDEIIGELLKRIWEAGFAGAPFRPLASLVELWNRETLAQLHRFPDPELAKKGCRLKEKLVETTTLPVLLATDLHAGNVLRAERKPWLAIDLKPYVGDRSYDLTQHLFNCIERLTADPKATIRRVSKLAGVDEKRVTDWMFARTASESGGAHQQLALKLGH